MSIYWREFDGATCSKCGTKDMGLYERALGICNDCFDVFYKGKKLEDHPLMKPKSIHSPPKLNISSF